MSQPAPGTLSPLDGRPLDPVSATPVEDIAGLVATARQAHLAWSARSLDDRIAAVMAFAADALERHEEIVSILMAETGRSRLECELNEGYGILEYAKGARKVARKALKPDKVFLNPVAFAGKKAVIEHLPRGVVGIIAPWNYPLGNFFKSLFPALFAGNAVVLKPSEHTPRAGAWLAEVAADNLPEGLVTLVQGGGEAGRVLLDQVDAVVFTGSVGTGRRVAARAGERLIPCSVELGGKDAAIVLADCELERTVAGIVQWSMHNAGQNCAGIERVYVVDEIADEFVASLAAAVGRLRVETGSGESELGPLQNAMQLAIVEDHVADAREKGAAVLAGGERVGIGLGYAATVIDRCKPGMKVVDEETFGPIVAVVRVPDAEAALEQANASRYGLNGSVWTRNLTQGGALARRLEVGLANVNNHSFGGIMPEVPWTGVKETGHGIAASRYSYSTYTRPRTVLVDRNRDPDPFWMPTDANLRIFASALYDLTRGLYGAVFRLLPVLGKRVKAIRRSTRP